MYVQTISQKVAGLRLHCESIPRRERSILLCCCKILSLYIKYLYEVRQSIFFSLSCYSYTNICAQKSIQKYIHAVCICQTRTKIPKFHVLDNGTVIYMSLMRPKTFLPPSHILGISISSTTRIFLPSRR